MKIAILSVFAPYRGGIAQFNDCLCRELSKEHDVKAFNFKRQYPKFLFPGKTQFVEGAGKVSPDATLDTANPFTFRTTARAIESWGPELLIVRYWTPYFSPSLGYVTRRLHGKGCKVISILDNVIPHERSFVDLPLTKYFLSGSDGYVTMCDAVRDELLAIKPGAEVKVIEHPVYSVFGKKMERSAAERSLALEPGMKNLLFFGFIREYKGLDILLDAFAGLPQDYRLIIAGEPYGSFDKYARKIEKLKIADRTKLFLEFIPDEKVRNYFSAADLLVLPYRSATQSGISSISEYFELPLVVTDVGGLKQTIGDAGTGLLAAAVTPAAVREAVLRYFSDQSIKESCICNMQKEKTRKSWSAFCEKLIGFGQGFDGNTRV